jgi:hypothetical protein
MAGWVGRRWLPRRRSKARRAAQNGTTPLSWCLIRQHIRALGCVMAPMVSSAGRSAAELQGQTGSARLRVMLGHVVIFSCYTRGGAGYVGNNCPTCRQWRGCWHGGRVHRGLRCFVCSPVEVVVGDHMLQGIHGIFSLQVKLRRCWLWLASGESLARTLVVIGDAGILRCHSTPSRHH